MERSGTPAPSHALQQDTLYSVEYPGYVAHGSIPIAINQLGGPDSLDAAFRRTSARKTPLLEINFRTSNPFSHPIPGNIVSTSNLLLKVVKRKYKSSSSSGSRFSSPFVGAYTTSIIGIINKTARFRSEKNTLSHLFLLI